MVWRHFFPSNRNPLGLESCPQQVTLQPGLTPQLRVGLLGDIMDIADSELEVADSVVQFFADCDVVIGNLEAPIAPAKTHRQQQRHHARLLHALQRLCPASKFILCLANNHAADYGLTVFQDSAQQIRAAGFQTFGTCEQPFVDVGDDLRVITGSQWTNMPCDFIADADDMKQYVDPTRFNLFYPHWGHEMECYPRGETVDWGLQWLDQTAGAVIGHHSHTPQPIQLCNVGGRTKLLATSLGDFCCRHRPLATRSYRYGTVMKLSLGRLPTGECDLLDLRWHFVESTDDADVVTVRLVENIPLFPGLKPLVC